MADHEDFLIDKRTFERNIKIGLISQKDYDQHISSLKDVEANAEVIDFASMDDSAGDGDAPSES